QDQALVWKLINDEATKSGWDHARDDEIKKMEEYYMEGKGVPVPDRQLRSRRVNVHGFHSSAAGDQQAGSESGEHSKVDHSGHKEAKATGHDVGEVVELGSHGEIIIEVPREQKKFLSNHGPAYGTYYAIYFLMTGLHGLHVIGGVVVMGYFLLFGKKLFLKDPEHMANRVEVVGLFWHFVDLVWIFLFPIMYLF
ncbi:MAG: cytochrome c oxidase subunit 3, partial [Verrucomicrobiales bacterium]|nr:cytochrome c oxidase subunit 3 [Verrucomicrobiales bacterium]